MLLLELSLQEQADRGQLGTQRLQGTGHTLEHSGTCYTRDPHADKPTQITLDIHYISLVGHRFTITHRYTPAPGPRWRLPHLSACLWATPMYTYHFPLSHSELPHMGSQGYGEEQGGKGANWAAFRAAVTQKAETVAEPLQLGYGFPYQGFGPSAISV